MTIVQYTPPQQLGSFFLGGIWLQQFVFLKFCLFLRRYPVSKFVCFASCADLHNPNSVHFSSAVSEPLHYFIVGSRWIFLLDAIRRVKVNCITCRRYLWFRCNCLNSVHFSSAVSLLKACTSTRFIFRRRYPFAAHAVLACPRGSFSVSVQNLLMPGQTIYRWFGHAATFNA